MVRRLTALAMVLAVLATGAACGGDDDDDGGGEALTEAEFIEQADQICADIEAEVDAQEPETDNPTPEEIEEYIDDVVVPNFQDQIDQISDLNPPEEIQDEVDELIDAAQEALDEVEGLSGDEVMELEGDPFEEVNAMAADLGLQECSD